MADMHVRTIYHVGARRYLRAYVLVQELKK